MFLRDLSLASAWMMRRNVGHDHWWRFGVITDKNTDADAPPKFDDARAQKIFDELISRGLLVERSDSVDSSKQSACTMKYDIDGWDKAVADGRPLYAIWLRVKRSWFLILVTFLLGCLITTVENRVTGLLDSLIDRVVVPKNEEPNKAVDSTAPRVTPPASSLCLGQESRHGQP